MRKMKRYWLMAPMLALALPVLASDDLLIFTDFTNTAYGSLVFNNGWHEQGSGARFCTNNPVHSGTLAYCLTPTAGNQSIKFTTDYLDSSLYTNVTFWINGGTGGQSVAVDGLLGGTDQTKVTISKLPTNSWMKVTLSLASLGCANKTNFSGIRIVSNSGSVQPTFFVDDVLLEAAPLPALVHVAIQSSKTVRQVDNRIFGVNADAWDGVLDTTNTVSVLNDMDNQVLRWPGGSWGDSYHFTNEYAAFKARGYGCVTTNFIHVVTNTRTPQQIYFIANYGSAEPAEAVQWVNFFNTTNRAYCKYWEIGNEIYGNWEVDNNTNLAYFGQEFAHDPWTYAMRFKDYYNAMKGVDPTIKIGAVASPNETAGSWTPVLLSTMKTNGVVPDFLIEHNYGPSDGDAYTLVIRSREWTSDAAALRRMLNTYLGTNAAASVELAVTEFGPRNGKQWVSLVGGLYYADSVGQVLQTEFNSLMWWNLRNGVQPITNSDNALYGWRTNSEGYFISNGGCVNGNAVPPDRYPGFYCMKLMQYFARGGDTVVSVTNDCTLLGTYAVKRTNGTLALLVINKSSSSNVTAALAINGYSPKTNAAIYSYGIAQDSAAVTGVGSMDIVQSNFFGAGAAFTNTFPPYSATVMVFTASNSPPMVNPDNFTMVENTTSTFTPLANDSVTTPGGNLSIVSVSPTNGVASISGTNVIFTPDTNFVGIATIGYVVTDNLGGTNGSVITVNVTPSLVETIVVTYTNSGIWLCPSNVTSVQVCCWGAGGGSGGSAVVSSGTSGAGGGGGGAFAAAKFAVTPANNPYTVTVGAGGVAGPANVAGNGGEGGPSWFGIASVITNVYAAGGAGGTNTYNGSVAGGGSGGANSLCNGDIVYSGGNGSRGGGSGGGGGGSAGGGGNGGDGAITSGGVAGPAGGGLPGGVAGAAGANGAGAGNSGTLFGGGAGGAKANTTGSGSGGMGGGGAITITFSTSSALATNAFLTSLTLNPAGLTTPFSSNTFSYVATNAYGSAPIVKVVDADLTATNWLIFNGTTNLLLSGQESGALSLNPNPSISNLVQVQVTAQDGMTTTTYLINVRQLPSQIPPTLTSVMSNNTLIFNWPTDHLGYRLEVQTNLPTVGLTSNWFTWPGSTNFNILAVPLVPTNSSMFFRLVYP